MGFLSELNEANFKAKDSLYVKNILPLYFQSLQLAQQDGDYSQADNLIESVYGFPRNLGVKYCPLKTK